jgi:hypothetical protein
LLKFKGAAYVGDLEANATASAWPLEPEYHSGEDELFGCAKLEVVMPSEEWLFRGMMIIRLFEGVDKGGWLAWHPVGADYGDECDGIFEVQGVVGFDDAFNEGTKTWCTKRVELNQDGQPTDCLDPTWLKAGWQPVPGTAYRTCIQFYDTNDNPIFDDVDCGPAIKCIGPGQFEELKSWVEIGAEPDGGGARL